MRKEKGSIAIFVLVALLFMTASLIILYAGNVNKAKTVKEQFETINRIYTYGGGDEGAYEKAYTDLRNKNKKNMTYSVENENTLELDKTFAKKLSNYKIYGTGDRTATKLPAAYQEVEYIESTGKQYIFIGDIAMSNIIAEIQYPNFPDGCRPNGGMDGSGNRGRLAIGINSNSKYTLNYGNISTTSSVSGDSAKHTYKVNISSNPVKADLFVDDIYIYSQQPTSSLSHPLYFTLFGYTGYGCTTPNYYCSCRIYKFILENQKELYPCYRKSDGEIGLYDILNDVFYTNQGTDPDTDPFVKGRNVGTVGDPVTDSSDENYGKYRIQIRVTNSNNEGNLYNIYLDKPLQENEYIEFATGKVVRSDGTQENIELPDIYLYEDYTKIEIITELSPAKVEIEYQGYTIGNERNVVLPVGYQEVEYIESTGTQYINTEFYPTGNTKVVIDFQMIDQSTSQQAIFGERTSGSSFILFTGGSINSYQMDYGSRGGYVTGNENINMNNRSLIEMTNKLVYNNTEVNSYSEATFTSTAPMYIFAFNNSGAKLNSKMKLYSLKIYDNERIKREFIPCYKDEEIGLYDIVNNQFYTNRGTGEFKKGKDSE